MRKIVFIISLLNFILPCACATLSADDQLTETDTEIKLSLDTLDAVIRKQGYVTGVAAQSLLDKQTGYRDAG